MREQELEQLKKEYFFSCVLCNKLQLGGNISLKGSDLFEKALGDEIPWKQWTVWISKQLEESQMIAKKQLQSKMDIKNLRALTMSQSQRTISSNTPALSIRQSRSPERQSVSSVPNMNYLSSAQRNLPSPHSDRSPLSRYSTFE